MISHELIYKFILFKYKYFFTYKYIYKNKILHMVIYKNKILHMVQLTSSSRDYLETHYMFKLSSFKN